ncbi:hypothetical protein [Arsukibacterium sp.]|uniref:hypothetical protein n=1 Tax=Arsukibacterium sp. TaxID=1977258 RepID=UPI002FD88317
MPLPEQLIVDISQIRLQFKQLLADDTFLESAAAVELIKQFEHLLLDYSVQAKSDKELADYLALQLSWLIIETNEITSQKMVVAEQLLQITRARKGNASYDNHKLE